MLASDIHIINRADLRKLSIFQAGTALAAHLNFSPIVQWKALPALLKSPRGLQQGERQQPFPLDGSEFARRLLSIAKDAIRNRQRIFIYKRLIERLRSLYLKGERDFFAPGSYRRCLLLVSKARFTIL